MEEHIVRQTDDRWTQRLVDWRPQFSKKNYRKFLDVFGR